jgi:NADH-quinone oxidoreductase subunit M
MALLGAFNAAWPAHLAGNDMPLALAVIAVSGVVLGALYMLWLAQRILFGEARAPHAPLADLDARESVILAAIVFAIFAIGLFPGEPLAKTELAAREFQQRVAGETIQPGSER